MMTTRTSGATPWLVLILTACSSTTTTQSTRGSGGDESAQGLAGGKATAGSKTSGSGGATSGGVGAVTSGGNGLSGSSQTSGGSAAGGTTQGSGNTSNLGGAITSGSGGQGLGSTAATGGSNALGGTSAAAGANTAAGARGGATSTGGATPIGGSTSASGAGTGGVARGGAGIGGAATGGASRGGAATGGAATGGAATGGAPAINQFVNGPCVTSPNLSDIEVFASSGQNIYRRVITATSAGSWLKLANLDATKLDIRSDLDCTASSNVVHVVATGASPAGAYMHAYGFGNAFNAFTRELSTGTPSTFDPPGASIATWAGLTDTRYQMAAAAGNPYWVFVQSTTLTTTLEPGNAYPLTSAPDIAIQQTNDPSHFEMVAYLSNGTMAYYDYSFGFSSSWLPATSAAPPNSTTYAYGPTLCTRSDTASSDYTRHVAAVAGGKLYYAHSGTDWTNGTTFTAWELAGNAVPASSPDCVVTSDNKVNIVILTATGSIARVSRTGVSGSWTTTDLGGY